MKMLFRLVSCVAVILFAVATAIKYLQGTSYKEAVGIMEEFWKEMKQRSSCCEESTPEV